MLHRAAAPPARRSRPTATGAGARPSRRGRPPFWRNRLLVGTMAAVVVVVGAIVVVAVRGGESGTGGAPAAQSATPASSAVMAAVGKPDPAVLAAVGSGGLPMTFASLGGAVAPLNGATGKPEVFYVGADYCPYCAAQRWSLVLALSRFGSFSHLDVTRSSPRDVFPDTATFTFDRSSYASGYVDFVAVEKADRLGQPLQTLSPAQQTLFSQYSVPPYVPAQAAGGIPWLDVANRYVMVGSNYSPQVLAGLDWEQIAGRLGDAADPVTQGIAGNANNITAAICRATGMQPASVCAAAPIPTLVATLR